MPKGRKKFLLIVLLLVLALGGYFAYRYQSGAKAQTVKKHMIVKVGEFVTNLAGSDNKRFVKIQIDVETESEEAGRELIAKSSQMRDQVLLVLRSKTVADLSGPEGMRRLGQDLLEKTNQILTSGKALAIYFVEFAIQ